MNHRYFSRNITSSSWAEMLKRFYFSWSVATVSAGFLVLLYTFILAYTNTTKSVLVTINEYGEANIEIVLLTLGFFLGLPTVIYYCIKGFNAPPRTSSLSDSRISDQGGETLQ